MMNSDRLQAIKARAEAATPGPWLFDGEELLAENEHGSVFVLQVYRQLPPPEGMARFENPFDGAFISAARSDVPDLIAEVERPTAALEQATEAGCAWQRSLARAEGERDAEHERADAALAQVERLTAASYALADDLAGQRNTSNEALYKLADALDDVERLRGLLGEWASETPDSCRMDCMWTRYPVSLDPTDPANHAPTCLWIRSRQALADK